MTNAKYMWTHTDYTFHPCQLPRSTYPVLTLQHCPTLSLSFSFLWLVRTDISHDHANHINYLESRRSGMPGLGYQLQVDAKKHVALNLPSQVSVSSSVVGVRDDLKQ